VKNRIIILSFGFLLSACSSVTPAAQEYVISPSLHVAQTQQSKYGTATVKVANIYAQNSLQSRNMYYVEDNLKRFPYTKSQWALSPKSMIHTEVMKMLSATKAFAFVQTPKSKVEAAYVLETKVNDFTQYFQENDSKSYVVVSMTFTLVDAKKHTIVDSKTFEAKVATHKLNAVGGVYAFNSALGEVLDDASAWIIEISR